MAFSWIIRRSSSSSSSDPEAGSTPMEDFPRFSTETQRRNGFRQSNLVDRGDRIIEDIRNGVYTCSICLEFIEGNSRKYELWHCRSCYTVYHFRCAKGWSQSYRDSFRSLRNPPRWSCPSCSALCPTPKATCWCGKESIGSRDLSSGRPNVCPNICDKVGRCPHGGEAKLCLKPCHPGPCNIPCCTTCPSRPVIPKSPSCWGRICTRLGQRERGSITIFVLWWTLLAIVYALLGVFISYHIQWNAKPFKYPGFDSEIETMALMISWWLLVAPLVMVLLVLIYMSTAALLIRMLNLNSRETKESRKIAGKFFGGIFLAAIFVGIFTVPIIGLAGGPDIAWNSQMKNSCNGFNTRISMDETHTIDDKTSWTPATKFNVSSLTPNISAYTMYLGSHLKPVIVSEEDQANSSSPFEYYQRLSVKRDSENFNPAVNIFEKEYFAVDVDIHNQLYRIMYLNQRDMENEFLAYEYKKHLTYLPEFSPVSEQLLMNGTFTKPNSTYKHMHIPELNIAIANMHDFIYHWKQEPFIKVYQNLNDRLWGSESYDDKFKATLNEPWDSKKIVPMEHELVMRTASFGHGRQRLDMCMQEVLDEDNRSVVFEEMFVPFAIMAAFRQRVYETDSDRRNS